MSGDDRDGEVDEPATAAAVIEEGDGPRTEMAAALRVIRREGWKAAVVEAAVEAAAAFLLANLLVTVAGFGPARIVLPTIGPVVAVGGATLPGSAVVAVAVGLAVFAAGLWLRVRRPLVEQFEAANPAVAEALRTARDAVEDGADSRMATRLYADVLDRLRGTSSLGLVRLRRVTGTLVVALALSAATTQVAVYDLRPAGGDAPESRVPADDGDPEFTGLRDGDAVLGDPEDVSAGDENLTARVESTGGDQELDDLGQFPSTGAGGGGGAVDSQQAGFDQPERIEDAELIREYNLRIREGEN